MPYYRHETLFLISIIMRITPLKIFWLILGFISLGLGTLGVFLPVLPTVPFYLLTAFCFAKSSERLHAWFTNTKLYKNHLESFAKKEGMTIQTKLSIMCSVSFMMAVGFVLMSRKHIWIPCIILAIVWLAHIIYFCFFVKTIHPSLTKEQIEKKRKKEDF